LEVAVTTRSLSEFLRLGTSSFSSSDWVGPFYPEGTPPSRFLEVYAGRYDTVEIDSTYYAVPSARTVEGWARKTPEGFTIAAKFPREIVHGGSGATPDPAKLLDPEFAYPVRDRFLQVMALLGPRLGPLVIQFPYFNKKAFPTERPFLERLDRFLADLPEGPRYAVEIRNRAWLTPAFADLCRHRRAAMVLVDQAWMPHADEVERTMDPVTADFTYVRLLGDRQEIENITTTWEKEVIDRTDRLRRWARFLARLTERRVPSFVYINNHYAGHAPATIEKLKRLFLDASEGDES
jgi:uncharacterized protein YecE (DUF72 family)